MLDRGQAEASRNPSQTGSATVGQAVTNVSMGFNWKPRSDSGGAQTSPPAVRGRTGLRRAFPDFFGFTTDVLSGL